MDLDVARAVDAGASLLGLSTEVFADADILSEDAERFLQNGDIILIGSPRGNRVTEWVFDTHGHRLQSRNSIYARFEPGHERTLIVGSRDEEHEFKSIDSAKYLGESDNFEYALLARYRNPWAPGKHLWTMAGLWGLGTQALADYLNSGGYRDLPWDTEGEAMSVLRIRYAAGNAKEESTPIRV